MLNSFRFGVARATRSWAMVLLLVVASIVFTLPIVVPVFLLIIQTSGGTFAPYRLLADGIDPYWLIDLFNEQFPAGSLASAIAQVILLAAVAGFFYLLANVLFAGGILTILSSPDGRFSFGRFWAGAGRYFARFLRLWLISLICYGFTFIGFALLRLPINAADARASAERPGAIMKWIAGGLLLLLLAIINMTFDYARIGAVLNDRRRMLRETLLAARFALRHFIRAFSLYLLIGLVGLLFFAILTALRGAITQSSVFAVLLAILLGQMAIGARLWTRLALYAAEIDLYQKLAPPSETEPVEVPPGPEFARAVKTGELPPLATEPATPPEPIETPQPPEPSPAKEPEREVPEIS